MIEEPEEVEIQQHPSEHELKLRIHKNISQQLHENGKWKDDEEITLQQEDENNVQISQKKKRKNKLLLEIKDMPEHLQFNPHIISGYRPLEHPFGCVRSMFHLHNETVNIITHAIPILYIIWTVPDVLPWHSKELTFLAWCHIAGILCPWFGSFVYHLFMNLNYGPMAYYILLQIDMLGIWTSQSIGALPLVFATTMCLSNAIRFLIITFYCFLSVWGLYKAMTAWSPWDRRLCFLYPFLTRIALWCLRLTKIGAGDPAAFLHIILQDVVSIVGACIGAIHIPEKWYPGSVDIFMNSHNIMHIMVVAAVWSMHKATTLDLHWMAKNQCH